MFDKDWFVNQTLAPSSVLLGIYWGAPVRWQGWVNLIALVVAVVVIGMWGIPDRLPAAILATASVFAVFLVLTVIKGHRVDDVGP